MTPQVLEMHKMVETNSSITGKTKKIFFPNLDGLRFITFFAVFLFHSGHTEFTEILNDPIYKTIKFGIFNYGDLGVNFFFVLSGFLITYLLSHEEFIRNTIDLKSFYIRRTLRIWPLYIACCLFGFVVFPLLKSAFGQQPNETANILLLASFLGNFNNILNGLPDASVLGVLWSVGVEEQFYLFWPLLFIVFIGRNKLWMFLAVIFASLIFRFFNYQNPYILYYHTLSVISDMALGGLIGWACFYNKANLVKIMNNMSKALIVMIYILGFTLIIVSKEFESQFMITFDRILLGIFFAFIIVEQNFSENSFYKIGKNKFLSYWGTYTYGLYCLHFVGILITTNIFKLLNMNNSLFHVLVIETVVSLILSMIISYISFNYFEKYFLKLKNKFSY